MARVAAAVLLLLAVAAPAAEPDPQLPAPVVGSVFTHVVTPGDSLALVGARYAVSVATLARVNGLKPSAMLHPGDSLLINNLHITSVDASAPLVMNVAQRMIFLRENGSVVGYPIGVGRSGWKTPRGRFTVIEKEENPTWDVPASIQAEMQRSGKPVLTHVPPGPDNPLGAYFIRLSFPNVGIHGTNAPSSVYKFVSHGCVRMHPDDVAALYPKVSVGTAGVSIYEPVLLTVHEGRVLLEVHADAYGRAAMDPLSQTQALATLLNVSAAIDWTLVSTAIRQQAGVAVDITANR